MKLGTKSTKRGNPKKVVKVVSLNKTRGSGQMVIWDSGFPCHMSKYQYIYEGNVCSINIA